MKAMTQSTRRMIAVAAIVAAILIAALMLFRDSIISLACTSPRLAMNDDCRPDANGHYKTFFVGCSGFF